MKKLLITGAQGQVGRELTEIAGGYGFHVIPCARDDLNIGDAEQTKQVLNSHVPDVVINAAAYTAVDKAEVEPDAAFTVNHLGAQNLARVCAALNIPLIHISTDYVFDGCKSTPYVETDLPNPLSVYGKSKLAGEQAIVEELGKYFILRTSWVFGKYGNNFVKTMLRLAKTQPLLKVVNDQFGSPTAANDIAVCLLRIADDALNSHSLPYGIYHFGGTPHTTWYEFSMAILKDLLGSTGYELKEVLAIPTSEYPTAATRPRYTCLDNGQISRFLSDLQADWRVNLRLVKNEL